jgi:hypothetical protein
VRAAIATTTAGVGSVVTLMGALFVILFGVVATSGVYGSRLAWLLGVAVPLLAITMLLAWLSLRIPSGDRAHDRAGRGVLLVAASLFGLPFAVAAMLLFTDACFFVVHGVSLLV